jgi:hypothetical protein
MKSAICFSWIVATFLLIGSLTLPSFQLESHAQIFAEDFGGFDRQADSIHSSSICRMRASGHRSAMPPTRTETAGEFFFPVGFPYRSMPFGTPHGKQKPHSFNVVLRI